MRYDLRSRRVKYGMVLGLAIGAILWGGAFQNGWAAEKFLTIGTCGPAGYWFQSGAVLADLINKNIKDVRANAQATACAVHNLGALNKKEIELGMSVNYLSYQAYTGTGQFQGKGPFNILGMTSWYRNYLLVFTLNDQIKSFSDFKGKRIIIGGAGSATEKTSIQLLKSCGLEAVKDYTPLRANLEPGIELMKGRQADIQMWLMPKKNAALLSLIETYNTYFISVPEAGGKNFCEILKPSFKLVEIPNGTYPKQKGPIRVASHMVDLLVIPDLDEQLVYQMVKTLFGKIDAFHESLGATAKDLNRESALAGITIPLHIGALKYFEEQKFPGLQDYYEVARNAKKVREGEASKR